MTYRLTNDEIELKILSKLIHTAFGLGSGLPLPSLLSPPTPSATITSAKPMSLHPPWSGKSSLLPIAKLLIEP